MKVVWHNLGTAVVLPVIRIFCGLGNDMGLSTPTHKVHSGREHPLDLPEQFGEGVSYLWELIAFSRR